MAEIIDALGITFRAKGANRTEMHPKPGIHPGSEDNFIHVMAGLHPGFTISRRQMDQWFSRKLQEGPSLTANLGLALDDMAVAPLHYKRAMEKGIGKWLEL